MTDRNPELARAPQSDKESVVFPTTRDIQAAIEMIGSGRLRLRLFLKSLQTYLGISDLQLDFVELIGRKNAISPTDLAIELDVNKATISGHLEKLIENNFVQEAPAPADKRKKLLSLTVQGKSLYEVIKGLQARMLKRLLEWVGPRTFYALNEHIKDIMESIDKKKHGIRGLIEAKPEGLLQILSEVPPKDIIELITQHFPLLFGDTNENQFDPRGDL